MKKIISVFLSVSVILSTILFSASALTKDESEAVLDAAYKNMYESVNGDVNKDGKFTAADARSALICSAGLSDGDINAVAADVDCDGKVTAADARALLRVSAKLDPDSVLSASAELNMFNALLNDIKASSLSFRKNSANTKVNITYDHKSDVDDFSNQMNDIAGEDEKMNFGEMLTDGIGKVDYNNSPSLKYASADNYPIMGNTFSSLLSLDNIDRIEHATNQTYKYQQLNDKTGTPSSLYPLIVRENVETFKVYIKSEKLYNIPTDQTTYDHGKCFDVMTQEALESGYKSINDMMGGDEMKDLTEQLGGRFNISVSHNYLKYYDSCITIYYDRNENKLCGVDYNLSYDFSMAMYIDIYLKNILTAIAGASIVFEDKTINVVNSDNIHEEYCFLDF